MALLQGPINDPALAFWQALDVTLETWSASHCLSPYLSKALTPSLHPRSTGGHFAVFQASSAPLSTPCSTSCSTSWNHFRRRPWRPSWRLTFSAPVCGEDELVWRSSKTTSVVASSLAWQPAS